MEHKVETGKENIHVIEGFYIKEKVRKKKEERRIFAYPVMVLNRDNHMLASGTKTKIVSVFIRKRQRKKRKEDIPNRCGGWRHFNRR